MNSLPADSVLVACPDARPPAYQAVTGLARQGLLRRFETAYYHRGDGALLHGLKKVAAGMALNLGKFLDRRHAPEIPNERVRSRWAFDLSISVERRLPPDRSEVRRRLARWRTEWFDRRLARALRDERPEAAIVFSDVGSEVALPACRKLGVASILSMVHGDVREERSILEREEATAPISFRFISVMGSSIAGS